MLIYKHAFRNLNQINQINKSILNRTTLNLIKLNDDQKVIFIS